MQVRGNVVTKHLRNQIQAAIGHALTEDGGPMSVANFATALVVEAIEAHGECHYCHRVDGEASI
jgi:Fe-S cluster biogenesis protein NfuA